MRFFLEDFGEFRGNIEDLFNTMAFEIQIDKISKSNVNALHLLGSALEIAHDM